MTGAIEICGNDDLALGGLSANRCNDVSVSPKNSGHGACPDRYRLLHEFPTGTDDAKCITEIQGSCGNQCGILSKGVPGEIGRLDARFRPQEP